MAVAKNTAVGNIDPFCGLTLADFLVPSVKTPVAQVTEVVVQASLDEAKALAGQQTTATDVQILGGTDIEPADDVHDVILTQVLDGWYEQDNDSDFAERREIWPLIDMTALRPSTDQKTRIQQNITAIRLLKQLQKEQRRASAQEMETMLTYSGWGGVSRVFSPDGSTPHSLAHLRDELKDISTPEEFAAMQSSVNTAFYTPPELVSAVWRMCEHLGFKGGRIIEPAAGAGHFIAGMPMGIAMKSDVTAVEIDKVSAQMLEQLYGPYGMQVHACGTETAKLPSGFYDLCISNVPFGDYKTNDTGKAPYADWSIHNWFLGKAVDLVRPGGLIAIVTSRHTMDSKRDAHRKWVGVHAELLGAFRLPQNAFGEFALTEVVTDVLVFRRRALPDYGVKTLWEDGEAKVPQEMMAQGLSNQRGVYAHGRSYPVSATINKYFAAKPQNVIGKLEWVKTQYAEEALPRFTGTTAEMCATLTERAESTLDANIYEPPARTMGAAPQSSMARYLNTGDSLPGSFVLRDGRVCISEGDELLDVDGLYSGTARARVLGLMAIRDAAVAVIEHQAKSEDDAELSSLQRTLNGTYDAFVSKLGYLSTTANSRVFRGDPQWPLMLALEIWDEEAGLAHKADIFDKRTVGKTTVPVKADTVKDGMLISLALYGKIVLKDIALRTGMPVMEVVKDLKAEALAYRDPILATWVPADEYLSGHIQVKIDQAKAAGAAYAQNVEALTAVLPPDLGPAEVEARLGAPWIPLDVIEAFAGYIVDIRVNEKINVSYDQTTATWAIKSSAYHLEGVGDRTKQMTQWGTRERCALVLIEAALNQQPPTITRTVDGSSIVDQQATLHAREKWQALRDEFKSWVYQDESRRDRLLKIYNEQFNRIVPRRYDGSHLHLPGMSKVLTPRAHQKDAIWRIVCGGNTLLAHAVGAGKTLVMVAAAMELRRLGKARKPVLVVPNHMLEQAASEALRLYPQAKLLMASKEDLSGDRRRTFVARVATGDWDLVVMTHSTFERLMLSPARQQTFIDGVLGEARAMLSVAEDSGSKRSIKELERRMKEYEAKITRLAEAGAGDATSVWFDDLGLDYLFADEVHFAKNAYRMSKLPRVAGLNNTTSNRAFDFLMKTRYIMGLHGDEEIGVVGASATPISNSLAEMWAMQMYFQPQTLKRLGIYEFDAWAASFGDTVTGMELSPDGSGYRLNSRFARFVNTPELMAIFRGMADVKTKAMLKLPTPRIKGGKPKVVTAEPGEKLKAYIETLVKRAEAIRSRGVKPEEDNMLKVTNDGRKAALDIRLALPGEAKEEGCKLDQVENEVFRIWEEGAEKRTTQLVFSDLGTPSTEGFSVYVALRAQLAARGIPMEQMEFIHDHETDAAKAKLFKRVREGSVRIVFGSTSKLGTGTNVQRLLKAIHQIDAPFRPSDVEQRDGRGERQGNLNEEIELLRYITTSSFDAYMWQLLDVKQRFIEQIMTADQGLRTVEDISMTTLSYAEIKAIASGNPLVLEKAQVDAKVQKLALMYDHFEQDRWQAGRRKASLQSRLAYLQSSIPKAAEDAKLLQAIDKNVALNPASRAIAVACDGAANNCEVVGAAFRCAAGMGDSQIGDIGGVMLHAEQGFKVVKLVVRLPHTGLRAEVDRPRITDLQGVGECVYDALNDYRDIEARMLREHADKSEELASIERLLQGTFPHAAELEEARQRQREIETALDLDKQTEGTAAMDAAQA